jgi:hypothetical protein
VLGATVTWAEAGIANATTPTAVAAAIAAPRVKRDMLVLLPWGGRRRPGLDRPARRPAAASA